MKSCVHPMNLYATRCVRPRLLLWPIVLVLVLALGNVGHTCTTFVLRDGDRVMFGKNFDWTIDDALVIANQRGIQKTALVVPFLNTPAKCLAYVETGDGDVSKSLKSLPRFSRASSSVKKFDSKNSTADRDYAFKTLDSVVSGNAQARTKTVWSIVYDIAERRVYYRTHRNPKLRWVSFEDFDFSAEVAARYLDINADGEGHVAEKTQVLTHDANAKYVREGAIRNKEENKKLMGDSAAAMNFYLGFIRTYKPKR